MHRLLRICTLIWALFGSGSPSKTFCEEKLPRHLYLVLGQKGLVSRENISLHSSARLGEKSFPAECRLQIVTCSTCVISMKVNNLREEVKPLNCTDDDFNARCFEPDLLRVYEENRPWLSYVYDNRTKSEGTTVYTSKSRYLTIHFQNWNSEERDFILEFTAEKNVLHFEGQPVGNNLTLGGFVKSPNFPSLYPRDIGIEYNIKCTLNTTSLCKIRLIFTDFLVADESLFQFYDWSGRKIRLRNTATRPSVILSSGPSLVMRFFAQGGSDVGFKAAYYFFTSEVLKKELMPITDCGGEVDNAGGGITMMNMAYAKQVKIYDCIWIIKPFQRYFSQKLNVYAKVITFRHFDRNAVLSIFEGQTSEGRLLETVTSSTDMTFETQHVVSGRSGYYVTFRGAFNSSSMLALAYSLFSNQVCLAGPGFICLNQRCINKRLYCDGFDQCGDNSDEPEICSKGWHPEPEERSWYSHIPNYYFPKVDRYLDMRMAAIIFTLSSAGLVFLIGALVLLLYRMGARAQQRRELHSRIQNISELFVGLDHEESRHTTPDEPPLYECPPAYEEVMKTEEGRRSGAASFSSCFGGISLLNRPNSSPPPPYCIDNPSPSIVNRSPGPSTGESGRSTEATNEFRPSLLPLSVGRTNCNCRSLLWNWIPRRLTRADQGSTIGGETILQRCSCPGNACNCSSAGPSTSSGVTATRRGKIGGLAATWSPASAAKMATLDFLLLNRENSVPAGFKNMKGSSSAESLFRTP